MQNHLPSFLLLLLVTQISGQLDIKSEEVDTHSVIIESSQTFALFFKGFYASLYVIIISELGDKTFFIAAIMSMQYSRLIVYVGAMGALATMTILSAIVGHATTVIPRSITFYCSGVLFVVFGLKMLFDAHKMSADDVKEEYEEVKQKLATSSIDLEAGNIDRPTNRSSFGRYKQVLPCIFSPILAEAFILTFLAEWGDRSQLTTIILAATYSIYGVIIGGVLGHAICTGLAVLVGRFIAQRIPVKWLTYIGGITFLVFAALTFFGNPDSNS